MGLRVVKFKLRTLLHSQECRNDDRGSGEGVKGLRVVKFKWRTLPHSQECRNDGGKGLRDGGWLSLSGGPSYIPKNVGMRMEARRGRTECLTSCRSNGGYELEGTAEVLAVLF